MPVVGDKTVKKPLDIIVAWMILIVDIVVLYILCPDPQRRIPASSNELILPLLGSEQIYFIHIHKFCPQGWRFEHQVAPWPANLGGHPRGPQSIAVGDHVAIEFEDVLKNIVVEGVDGGRSLVR